MSAAPAGRSATCRRRRRRSRRGRLDCPPARGGGSRDPAPTRRAGRTGAHHRACRRRGSGAASRCPRRSARGRPRAARGRAGDVGVGVPGGGAIAGDLHPGPAAFQQPQHSPEPRRGGALGGPRAAHVVEHQRHRQGAELRRQGGEVVGVGVELQMPPERRDPAHHRVELLDRRAAARGDVEPNAAGAARVHGGEVGGGRGVVDHDDGAIADAEFRGRIERAAIVGAVDRGLHDDAAREAERVSDAAIGGDRGGLLGRVAAVRAERIAVGGAEDVEVAVAAARRRAPGRRGHGLARRQAGVHGRGRYGAEGWVWRRDARAVSV